MLGLVASRTLGFLRGAVGLIASGILISLEGTLDVGIAVEIGVGVGVEIAVEIGAGVDVGVGAGVGAGVDADLSVATQVDRCRLSPGAIAKPLVKHISRIWRVDKWS